MAELNEIKEHTFETAMLIYYNPKVMNEQERIFEPVSVTVKLRNYSQ
jgi:hypothetical protein